MKNVYEIVVYSKNTFGQNKSNWFNVESRKYIRELLKLDFNNNALEVISKEFKCLKIYITNDAQKNARGIIF